LHEFCAHKYGDETTKQAKKCSLYCHLGYFIPGICLSTADSQSDSDLCRKKDRQIKGRITDRTDTGTDGGKGGQTRKGMTDISNGDTAQTRGGGMKHISKLEEKRSRRL
jgi:hypothetical protein